MAVDVATLVIAAVIVGSVVTGLLYFILLPWWRERKMPRFPGEQKGFIHVFGVTPDGSLKVIEGYAVKTTLHLGEYQELIRDNIVKHVLSLPREQKQLIYNMLEGQADASADPEAARTIETLETVEEPFPFHLQPYGVGDDTIIIQYDLNRNGEAEPRDLLDYGFPEPEAKAPFPYIAAPESYVFGFLQPIPLKLLLGRTGRLMQLLGMLPINVEGGVNAYLLYPLDFQRLRVLALDHDSVSKLSMWLEAASAYADVTKLEQLLDTREEELESYRRTFKKLRAEFGEKVADYESALAAATFATKGQLPLSPKEKLALSGFVHYIIGAFIGLLLPTLTPKLHAGVSVAVCSGVALAIWYWREVRI
jgi:hypothetical protein